MSVHNITNDISSETMQFTFGSVDYTVFVLMLAVSAGIGVFFGFFAKGADTTEEYLLGGKRMKTIPIAISLVASQLSGISIMTIPAEMYSFGLNWFCNVLSMLVVVPLLCWVVVPVFYNNNISNCYEYLELRFNRETRQLLTLAFLVTGIFLLPIFVFIPALAFSQVTGINIHLINAVVCSICTFYTMFVSLTNSLQAVLGGIKAVVWTDVVQAAIMVISVVLVGVLGMVKVGGFAEVIKIAVEGGRLEMDLTFDATTRGTLWNYYIGATILWSSYVGLNQSCVQRLVALPSLQHAKRCLGLFGFGFMLIMSFNCFTGIIMYARYHNCDPLQLGLVEKADKLMPFFVQDVAGHLKGMPGLFISCVFSAALSTLSASLNSLSGVVYFDYIKPHIKHTESRANIIMKAFVFAMGLYCICSGVIVEKSSSILQIAYSVSGVAFGAVFGVFLLGMLVPRTHGRAAFWGVIASMLLMLVIVVGAQGRLHYTQLPTSVDGCTVANMSSKARRWLTTPAPHSQESEGGFNLFEISFNWYAVVGAITVFVVAIPLSYLLQPDRDAKFDQKLLSPIVQSFVRYELTQVEELPEMLHTVNLKQ